MYATTGSTVDATCYKQVAEFLDLANRELRLGRFAIDPKSSEVLFVFRSACGNWELTETEIDGIVLMAFLRFSVYQNGFLAVSSGQKTPREAIGETV